MRDITKIFTAGDRLLLPARKDDKTDADRRTITIQEILRNPKARELADKLRMELEVSDTERTE